MVESSLKLGFVMRICRWLFHARSTWNSHGKIRKLSESQLILKPHSNHDYSSKKLKNYFIGSGIAAGVIYYLTYSVYEQKSICVKIPPPLPNLGLREDESTLQQLEYVVKSQKGPLKLVHVVGPCGAGKSTTVYHYAEKETNQDSFLSSFPLPRSTIYAFLDCVSEQKFLFSMEQFANDLADKYMDKEYAEKLRNVQPSQKIDYLFSFVYEKLQEHPGWMMIFDNINSVSGSLLYNTLSKWVTEYKNEKLQGTFIMVSDDPRNISHDQYPNTYCLKSLSLEGALQLFYQNSNIKRTPLVDNSVKCLVETVLLLPLSVSSSAMLVRQRLQDQAPIPIDEAIRSVSRDLIRDVKLVLNSNNISPTDSNVSIVMSEVVIGMALKNHFQNFSCDAKNNFGRIHERIFNFLSFSSPSFECPELVVRRFLDASRTSLSVDSPHSEKTMISANHQTTLPTTFQEVYDHIKSSDLQTILKELRDSYHLIKESFNSSDKRQNFNPDEKLSAEHKSMHFLRISQRHGQDWISLHPLVYDVARQFLSSHSLKLYERVENRKSRERNAGLWSKIRSYIPQFSSSTIESPSLVVDFLSKNSSMICSLGLLLINPNESVLDSQVRIQWIWNFFNCLQYALNYQEPKRIPHRKNVTLYRSKTLKHILSLIQEKSLSDDSLIYPEELFNRYPLDESIFLHHIFFTLAQCYETVGDFRQMEANLQNAQKLIGIYRNNSLSWSKVRHLSARISCSLARCYFEMKDIPSSVVQFERAWETLRSLMKPNPPKDLYLEIVELYRMRALLSPHYATLNSQQYDPFLDSTYWLSWAYRLKMEYFAITGVNDEFDVESMASLNALLSESLAQSGQYELCWFVIEPAKEFNKLYHEDLFNIKHRNSNELDAKITFLLHILGVYFGSSKLIDA